MFTIFDILCAISLCVAAAFLVPAILGQFSRQKTNARLRRSLNETGTRERFTLPSQKGSFLLATFIRLGRMLYRISFIRKVLLTLAERPSVTITRGPVIRAAGLHRKITVQDVIGAQFAAGLVCFLLFGPFILSGRLSFIILALIGALIGYTYPQVALKRLADERKAEIQRTLSRATDILVVATEAGLPLSRAIDLYCERFQGPLAEELAEAQRRIRLGERQRDVFIDMVESLGIEDLRTLIMAILQAERSGVEIAQILREQSEDLKLRREERIRSESQKVPVKMLFPLVFFLLPAVLIVVLGPVVIQFFSKGSGIFK